MCDLNDLYRKHKKLEEELENIKKEIRKKEERKIQRVMDFLKKNVEMFEHDRTSCNDIDPCNYNRGCPRCLAIAIKDEKLLTEDFLFLNLTIEYLLREEY
ncbi:MAG: hypothetical protein KatS3mg002_0402 [Candidatus Woesearchaeota archaeon]|nr:MAG: hypothetical protein KatS3mg002_0402 [Candidatus Woesearchaeota archaeon]